MGHFKFEPEELIKEAVLRYGNRLGVACSFGKDSIAVLHMALKYDKNIKVFFHNTGVEFPETIEYKNTIAALWNLNLVETKPYKDMTFWKCVDKYGLPTSRGTNRKYHSPKCCWYLKEKPALNAFKQHSIAAVITGLMKCESRNRALLITRMDNSINEHEGVGYCGQRYFAHSWGVWKLHPIAHWKEADVWKYIRTNRIPINKVYEKWGGIYRRCGCLPCTAYLDWETKLSKSHRALYRRLKQIESPTQKGMTDFGGSS